MLPKVNVMVVTVPPAIGKVEMMQGIRSKDEAQNWAERNGYPVVYWLKSRQRVYADKTSKVVKADPLFAPSEKGDCSIELVLILLVIGVVVYWIVTGAKL